jgi:hypothetical protein
MKNTEAQLEALSLAWVEAKTEERNANAKRIGVEEQIIEILGSKEGREKVTLDNGTQINVVTRMIYKADDLDSIVEVTHGLQDQFKPYKTETKLDESKIKKIRTFQPALWRQLALYVTVRPAKTFVVVTLPGNEDDGV